MSNSSQYLFIYLFIYLFLFLKHTHTALGGIFPKKSFVQLAASFFFLVAKARNFATKQNP
jgi:hypothetical protein